MIPESWMIFSIFGHQLAALVGVGDGVGLGQERVELRVRRRRSRSTRRRSGRRARRPARRAGACSTRSPRRDSRVQLFQKVLPGRIVRFTLMPASRSCAATASQVLRLKSSSSEISSSSVSAWPASVISALAFSGSRAGAGSSKYSGCIGPTWWLSALRRGPGSRGRGRRRCRRRAGRRCGPSGCRRAAA